MTKVPDQPRYLYGAVVELTAVPAAGWSFSGWSGALTGSSNPSSVTMNGDKSVIATFTKNEYTLNVETVGSGSVGKIPNQSAYHLGDVIQLTALADPGWSFSSWSGALTGGANPAELIVDGDMLVTATFTKDPIADLFADDFESGNFNVWTGTSIIRANTGVTSTLPHSGIYSAQYSAGSSTAIRRAYSYKSIPSQSELCAKSYVYIADGLPVTSGQSVWLVQFVTSSGSAVASYGLRGGSSGTKWTVQDGSYPNAMAASGPVEGKWYLFEAYYVQASSGKTIVLTVDGVEVASLSQSTIGNSDVVSVRFGICYCLSSQATTIRVDDVAISN